VNSLNAAIAGCPLAAATAVVVVASIAVAFAAAIAAAITLPSTVTIAAASTDISASARLASPDAWAWACGDNSPSRHDTLELKAWWRGRASFEQIFLARCKKFQGQF
jgi:hypothetical protein